MTKQAWTEIKKVCLTERHLNPGRTKHYLGWGDRRAEFPPFRSLVIAQYPSDSGFCLPHLCADGTGTDTYHSSVDEAMHQAEYEFNVTREEWTEPDKAASTGHS